jgi:hypothetical protein
MNMHLLGFLYASLTTMKIFFLCDNEEEKREKDIKMSSMEKEKNFSLCMIFYNHSYFSIKLRYHKMI